MLMETAAALSGSPLQTFVARRLQARLEDCCPAVIIRRHGQKDSPPRRCCRALGQRPALSRMFVQSLELLPHLPASQVCSSIAPRGPNHPIVIRSRGGLSANEGLNWWSHELRIARTRKVERLARNSCADPMEGWGSTEMPSTSAGRRASFLIFIAITFSSPATG